MDWTNTEQWDRRNNNGPRMNEKVEMLKLDGKWRTVRFVGKPVAIASHWINIYNPDSKKKPKGFPKPCHGAYVADDGSIQINSEKCPYCTILENAPTITTYTNVIDRHEQERKPRKTGKPSRYEKKKRKVHGTVGFFKEDRETEAWTPIRVVRVTTSLGKKISEIASLNTRKTEEGKKAFGPDNRKFGFDLMLKYNEEAKSPNDYYSAQKGENSKLTEEEMEYLLWNIPNEVTETVKDAEKEAKRVKPKVATRENVPMFPELEEGKKKKSKGDKHGKYRDQFDDNDDDAEDDDDEDDDDDKKSSKKKNKKDKKSSKSKGKSRHDDDDDEWDDEDEDSDDEDDDDSDDSDDTDDDDDSDGDDDTDDDDDEDDEDDRRSKKSKSSKSKSKVKSKKSRRRDEEEEEDDDEDDDEDEDDDDADEDDEDDRRSSKKSKKSKSRDKDKKKSKKKKRSRDDDDDDDDIPF